MLKLLNLFIHQPFSLWEREYNYGELLSPDAGRLTDHVSLQTDQSDQYIYAACSGELSVGLPVFASVNLEQLPDDLAGEELPESADLCLMLNPLARTAGQLLGNVSALAGFDSNIQGFLYFNVDVQTLMEDLREMLRWSTVPPADANISDDEVKQRMSLFLKGALSVYVEGGQRLGKPGRNPDPSTSALYQVGFSVVTSSGLWNPGDTYDRMRNFVDEEQDITDFLVLVPKPPTLFAGAPSKTAAIQMTETMIYAWSDLLSLRNDWSLTRADWRQVGDNQKTLYRKMLLARNGLLPAGIQAIPFEFNSLDWQNLFQLEAVVEYYANFDDPLAKDANNHPSVPIDISPSDHADLDRAGLVIRGANARIPNQNIVLDGSPDFQKVRPFHHYVYLEKSVGTHWYRITGVLAGGTLAAVDSRGQPPRFPQGVTGSPWQIDLYTTVDFLPLAGSAAAINGNEVTVEGSLDLSRIKAKDATPNNSECLCDGIIFDSDPDRMYLIASIDPHANKLILDSVPSQLDGTSSAWKISHVPVLVLIDPLGPREGLIGEVATKTAASTVMLETTSPALQKVNKDGFETIYLPADVARSSKTYRIITINEAAKTLKLDGDPEFPPANPVSAWSIPAGIGGRLPPLVYNLGPGDTKGYDHYDGVMFVVDNGDLTQQFRWTSYTSRTSQDSQLAGGGWASIKGGHRSIRGNHRYEVLSNPLSPPPDGSEYRNYCFRINDNIERDNVFIARGYFEPRPTPGGQRRIRFHDGNQGSLKKQRKGTGSAGCNVSPEFHQFRQVLIDIYQRRYVFLRIPDRPRDPEVDKLNKKDCNDIIELWRNTFLPENAGKDVQKLDSAGWQYKIFCYYWLIRPDERPIGS